MRITVLGKSPSWPDAGGACSGYLVQQGDTTLLLDCGNGVFGKLRQFVDYTDVDAVVLSHLHADHILDVIPYAYGLLYAPRQQPVPVHVWRGTDEPARPRLIGPPGTRDVFRQLGRAWNGEDVVERAFDICEYGIDEIAEVGPLSIAFCEVPHFTTTHAVEISQPDGRRFTYGADHRPSDELVEFALDTDLLLIEATLPRPEREGIRGHLTPGEAGEHARRARARRVVLTHVSDELDAGWVRTEAEKAYGAPVSMALEGVVYEV